MDLGPSSTVASAVLRPQAETTFVLPMADSRVLDTEGDPAEVAAARESVRLAFVAALQHLPARQRAVLILCEVLRWPATEVGELLDTSVASVNSALQRARATLADLDIDQLDATVDPEHEELLARYVDAFERYDMTTLAQLLRDDVVISMPPHDLWLEGPDNVVGWMVGPGQDCAGSKLIPLQLSGSAAFAQYKPAAEGGWEPWSIQVIEVRDGKISGHHNFLDDFGGIRLGLFEELGLPTHLDA
jgi:RNA polymerase sigma-70 factor (ECF subfamily)